MLPEVAGFLRLEPEPVEPERRQEQQQGQDVRAEQITPATVESERTAAEVRMRDHKAQLARLEEGVIERERQHAQHRSRHDALDERRRSATERDADYAPRGPAQAVTSRRGQGEGDEQADEERGESPGGAVDQLSISEPGRE